MKLFVRYRNLTTRKVEVTKVNHGRGIEETETISKLQYILCFDVPHHPQIHYAKFRIFFNGTELTGGKVIDWGLKDGDTIDLGVGVRANAKLLGDHIDHRCPAENAQNVHFNLVPLK